MLRAMLKGTAQQRSAALFPLRGLGPRAAAALPELLPLVATEPLNTTDVIGAAVALDPGGERTIPALLKALDGLPADAPANTAPRDAVFRGLTAYGPRAAGAVPALREHFKATGGTGDACALAAALGPKAEPLLPFFLDALADPRANKPVPDMLAARVLAAIGAKSDAVLKALRARLPAAQGHGGLAVVLALAELADDKDANALVARALDPKSPLCGLVLSELHRFPAVRAKHADAVRALADADGPDRLFAIRELIALGAGARYAEYLTDRISSKGYEFGLAVKLLGALGPDAAAAEPALRKLLPTVQYDWEAQEIEAALRAVTAPRKR